MKMNFRKAFTMLELVFVIVMVGILSAMIAPNFQRNSLREAADQVISHIRYTQHLAMMDDKYGSDTNFWYKHRWTIRFVQNLVYTNLNCTNATYNNIWSYMIYSNTACHSAGCSTNPNASEIAHSPLDPNQLLSGGYDNDLCIDNTENATNQQTMKTMRLGEKFGVQSITFSGGCRASVKYINFDSLGRPSNSFPANLPYELATPGWHKLLTAPCNIQLSDGTNNITIAIEPETGYAHIL